MSTTPRPCIDCGTPCYGYRCIHCGARERCTYLAATGKRTGGDHGTTVRAHYQRALAEFAADIEADLEAGITPDRIVANLGIQSASLHRRLMRGGYPDLAAKFPQRNARYARAAA